MHHRGRDRVWHRLFDPAQEKGVGTDGAIARPGGYLPGWIERPDQRDPARWARTGPGLVPARYVSDGAHLRADRTTVATVSGARNLQKPVDPGRGLFHVH